jgi:hypothetical protein
MRKLFVVLYLWTLIIIVLLIILFDSSYSIYQEHKTTISIIFVVLAIILTILTYADKLRNKIFRITLFDMFSLKRWSLFLFCIFLSIFFLNYYSLSSRANDNILPDNLKFNVIEISGILGGLVLTAASIKTSRLNNRFRKKFLSVASELIAATILLIFFTVATY